MNGAVYDACAVGPTLTTNKGEGNKIAVPVDCIDDTQGFDGIRVYQDEAPTLRSQRGGLKVALPVLTPDRAEKRQNGRRFKDDGEQMFTLTGQDKHGVATKVVGDREVYAVWYEKYQCYIAIRKLTPKECFRLQGWTDDYFEKAEFVNSNSQLYKQAGNGVTVNVIEAIARKMV
ncbi:MAG: DNA cytosine methyltransferase [Anaerotignum sp.]|nr:DNA cytosine methyltransferase [Anaerotignum sp.]